ERNRHGQAIFRSEAMKTLYQQVQRLASIAEPVVIMGPSGCGKELVATALHFDGVRRSGPFIATNAASLPVSLAEDELFGHEKGAFTGAAGQRIGCIERAHGGTLFLDEIADLDVQIQAKLLRVLETGQFLRLGGVELVFVNVRIIAATHKNLPRLVETGAFRQDLWYRLCAFIVNVPALAQRPDDIAILAEHFLQKTCADIGSSRTFSDDGLEALCSRDYPGNVRELRHIVTRAAVLSDSPLITKETINAVANTSNGEKRSDSSSGQLLVEYQKLDYKTAREKFEREYLTMILAANNNNITSAAAAIGMAQSNLSRKLKEIGIR
ncbi:MAG: sigma-54-dependent Fis family transcriptional regulator, partial [Chitinivibrionales bacterium]|nr:sigma-54-dependent Fis family transcriptional regulator [Chitinivibrionales bacterium]